MSTKDEETNVTDTEVNETETNNTNNELKTNNTNNELKTNDNTEQDTLSDSDFKKIDKDDDLEKQAEVLQITQEFQENVIKYVKYDDLIRRKNDEIKKLKKQKKPCEEYIIKYLDREDINCIEINDGKLRKNKSENKVPLNQETIKDAIGKKITDPEVIKEILKIMDNRPKKVNVNIKRTLNRRKRTKK